MIEVIVIGVALCLYLFSSSIVYKWLSKSKTWMFGLISVAYLIATYFYLLLILKLDQLIIEPFEIKEYSYINEMVMAAFFVCSLIAVINIIGAMVMSEQKKEISVDSSTRFASN